MLEGAQVRRRAEMRTSRIRIVDFLDDYARVDRPRMAAETEISDG